MRIRPLSPDRAAVLGQQPPTCPVVPVSQPPEGYAPISASATLERRDFDETVADLFAWKMHALSGLTVATTNLPLQADALVLLSMGGGPLAVKAPCRVIDVIQEPHRAGFSYVTLPGHPESGVERFVVSAGVDHRLTLSIDGYSRPRSRAARLVPRLARLMQTKVTRRYLGALDRT